MSGRRPVLLATTNRAKQDEMRRLLEGLEVAAVTPAEAGVAEPPIAETGATHLDNALTKARAWAAASGLPSLASDGGLHIPALGQRWDGLRSRRFAGPTDDERIAALLALMEGIAGPERVAFFREAAALVAPEGGVVAAAEVEGPQGRIAEHADLRRRPGFWVPSVWLFPPRWVTEFDLTDVERLGLETAWGRLAEAIHLDMENRLPPVTLRGRPAW